MFQELIVLKLINFFSLEDKRFKNKLLFKSKIYEIISIINKTLRGNILLNFSIKK
jgi:hypothetical protein